jgi:hypothetical protein
VISFPFSLLTVEGNSNPSICNIARWAKSNAFVMLVGLNGNGDSLSLAGRDFVKRFFRRCFKNLILKLSNSWVIPLFY